MSAAGEPVTLSRQLAAVAREVVMRRKCYPKWVARGTMDAREAEDELRAMEAVQATLCAILDNPPAPGALLEGEVLGFARLIAERFPRHPAPGGRK